MATFVPVPMPSLGGAGGGTSSVGAGGVTASVVDACGSVGIITGSERGIIAPPTGRAIIAGVGGGPAGGAPTRDSIADSKAARVA